MSYAGIGNAINALFKLLFVLVVVFVPLGLWKIIDIVIWVISHVKVSLG